MKSIFAALLLGLPAAFYLQAEKEPRLDSMSAETYEHLATAIIEIEHTEDLLVKGLLAEYHRMAQGQLAAAGLQSGADQKTMLESAAEEIANIANEGDKRVQAVRQRLLKAGHTHNTDAVTKEDYMFIDSKEKKSLIDMAKAVGGMGSAKPGDLDKARQDLKSVFEKAIATQ